MQSAALGLAALVALAACTAPSDLRSQRQPDALVNLPPAAAARPRLWYVGLGMQGETWSEDDVAEAATRLDQVATGYKVEPLVFSNRLQGMPEHYPAVNGQSVEEAMTAIAQRAEPGDIVVIYVSTHGAPGLLGRSAGGQELAPVGADQLRRWLAPLGDRDTVLILSACFSGSFIPPLKNDHRIIFAAARADRTSFGCQAGAEHTVFGEALLRSLAPGRSLRAVVDDTRAAVTARERAMRFTPPSLPQVSVGSDVERLYDAPVF